MEKRLVQVRFEEEHININSTLDELIADLQRIKDDYITGEIVSHKIELFSNGYIEIRTYRVENDFERLTRDVEYLKQKTVKQAESIIRLKKLLNDQYGLLTKDELIDGIMSPTGFN